MYNNVNTLTLGEPDYPSVLANIPSPPAKLYLSGQAVCQWIDKPKVAIVGSRKFTSYGQVVAAKLAAELSRAGVVIISGLAFGIDVTAHQAALAAGGQTVAVLGSGLDQISPRSHYNIAQQIKRQGTIITEYPAGANTYAGNFVIRNRIISGLSDVVVVPEAALKSGSLHTARFALEQGKTVMAVPGNINSPASEGCNNLIKSGALPVTSVDDIFFALKINPKKEKLAKSFTGSPQETLIIKLMEQGVTDQDQLAVAAKMDGRKLFSSLTMLEINGYIRPAGAGNWVLA